MAPAIYVFERQYGDFAARIPILAGCGASGPTAESAVRKAQSTFVEMRDRLAAEGTCVDAWRELDPSRFTIVHYRGVGFFAEDGGRLDADDIEQQLAQLDASAAAIWDAVDDLAPSDAEWVPQHGEWSIRQVLDHLIEAELRWTSILDAISGGSFATHHAVHQALRRRIAKMLSTPAGAAADRSYFGSRWTAKRVVRRMLEHQVDHLGHIREILSARRAERSA